MNQKPNIMKIKSLMIVGLLISLSSFSQNLKSKAQDPTGMILVSGGIYIMEVEPGYTKDVKVDDFWISNEISNKEFRKFYEDIINNPNDTITWVDLSKMETNRSTSDKEIIKPVVVKKSYKDISPKIIDLTVCNSIPDKENYFTDSKYDNYPVIGVTWEGARYYCIWRTNEENKKLKGQDKAFQMDYRLPTSHEWIAVPSVNVDYVPELHEVLKGDKNELGVFNMNSNVAEWTSTSSDNDKPESKDVMGRSWRSGSRRQISEQVPAEKATDYIGFRIVKSSANK